MLVIPYGGKYILNHGIAYAIEIKRSLTEKQYKYLRQWWKKNHIQIITELRGWQR